MRGNFFATYGYSRYLDHKGGTDGWVMFGTGCSSPEEEIQATIVMLNLFGFEAPAEITPAPGGDPVSIAVIARLPRRTLILINIYHMF